MLRITSIANLHGRKFMYAYCRSIHSGRVPHLLTKSSYESASSEGRPRDGYGEKEICLLSPIDVRTPLPGNTGIPPLSMLFTNTIQELPLPAGDHCEVTRSPLPEERYENMLTQAACVAAESLLKSPDQLECLGYKCPQLLKQDFLDLFPSRNLQTENLTVITFCQKTENDMSVWSENAEEERRELDHLFISAAKVVCGHLKQFNYWADFIHPNSGKPNLAPVTNATMFETDSRYRNFGFSIEDLGCCRIISHHEWGTHIHVGAIFTNASLESKEVQEILRKNKTQNSTTNMT